MTMAVIVACKDNFYIIADTLTCNPNNQTFSLNNQKVFSSSKHKIGLCIAGQASLISKNLDRDAVNISYALREFFVYIDTLVDVQVETLGTTLEDFVDQHYSEYHNYFKFQSPGTKHDNDVSYFYGGFDANGAVVVYGHHEGLIAQSQYDSSVPYFSVYSQSVSHYINFAIDLSKLPPGITKEQALIKLLDQHKEFVLTHCVPQACMNVNSQHPYSIGKILHFANLHKDHANIRQYCIKYEGDIDNVKHVVSLTLPPYTLYKTDAEAILANAVAYSSVNGHQVQRFISNPSTEEQSAEDAGPVVSTSGTLASVMGAADDHGEYSDSNASLSASPD